MAELVYFFSVARYTGSAFDKPVRTIAAHPIAAAERVARTKLYLIGNPDNLWAEVSYFSLAGEVESVLIYAGLRDRSS